MKILKIAPEHIYIKIEEATAGALDTSSRESAIENAEVLDVGENVEWPKKGDKILFKSWGIDFTTLDGKRYCFVDMKTRAVKAVYK